MNGDTQQMSGILAAVFGFYAVFLLVILTAVIIPLWFICKKAGFSPWLSFLIIVPFGGLVLLYVLAFAEWKVVPAPHLAFQTPLPPPPPQQPPLPPQV
jgi:intracellular septation protein A